MLTLTSPIETPLHRLPAGLKLAALCLATILLFHIGDPKALTAILLVVAVIYLGCGWASFRQGVRMLRPLVPFIIVIAVWHLWIADLRGGLLIALRFTSAVAIANLVTMTTRLSDMIAVIERIAQPLARVGLKPRTLALAMALAVRFIPVLGQKAEQIGMAWKARSARRSHWRIMVPLVLAVLDDAEHVAEALRARGGID